MGLFPDQAIFLPQLAESLHRHGSIIAQAPTGYGKSVVFVEIAVRAMAKGTTVLFLTESKKIFEQIQARIPAVLIDPKAGKLFLPHGYCYIAMAQTLNNRKEFINKFNELGSNLLVIVDEAHVGTFNKLLSQLTKAKRIGFTATPDARWAKHLPTFYKSIVVGPSVHDLVLSGRLTPYRHFARVSADLDLLKLHKGEFTEESQEQVFGTAKVFEGLVEDLTKVPYKKCLIFTASIKDCSSVTNQLKRAGFNCVEVHSKLKDAEFSYNLGQFTKGSVNICVSVGTLTKGFDFPAIDLIVLRRKTSSLPLFLQMLGRGSRVYPNKRFFTVLDYGGNYITHGMWDMERDWKDIWNKPKKNKEGVAPIKLCPVCEYIVPSSASVCPNCEYRFVKSDTPLEVGKLVEITERYQKMIGKRLSDLTAEELSIYARLKGKNLYAARVALARDIAKPNEGFLYEYAKSMGYKSSWVDFKRKSAGEEVKYNDFELK